MHRPYLGRRLLLRAALGMTLASATAAIVAQARRWPEKPVRLVVGYTTGGAADAIGRQLQPQLEATLGQPLIFDYRPGAGGLIAADYTVRAAADGYTMYLTDLAPLTILPNARKLSYDPLTSFTPVGMVVTGGTVIAAHPSFPADNVAQLIALLKAKPGVTVFGTSGVGGPGHLAAELFQAMSGTSMTHIPYKGGGPAMLDLLGGQVRLLFASAGTAVPYVQGGKIKALGVTGATRTAALPDIPTVAEQGLKGYEASNWFGLVGPAALPPEIVTRTNMAMNGALAVPGVQEGIRRLGYAPAPGTPSQFAERIKLDLAKWGGIIRERKLSFG
jgi:tripartite-type tricarboxylate transporter receptor subunit TctC